MTDDTRHEPEPTTASLKQGIAETRDSLSLTINALEARLNPPDLHEKIDAGLAKMEARAKALIAEEMDELEAKARQGASDAAAAIKSGLIEAKESIKSDLREAFQGAKQSLRAATVGRVETLATTLGDKMIDTKDTLIDTVRANPIPAALVGAGVIWLLMNRSKSASRRGNRYTTGPRNSEISGNSFGRSTIGGFESEMAGFEEGVESKVESKVESAAQGVAEVASKAGGAIGSAVSSAASGVSSMASRAAKQTAGAAKLVANNAKGAAQKIGHQAGQIYSSASAGAKKGADFAEEKYKTTLEENPLLIAGAVMAIGAIIGLSIPRSQREDSLMGSSRDRLLRRAGAAAKEAAQSVADLAEDAIENKRPFNEMNHAQA